VRKAARRPTHRARSRAASAGFAEEREILIVKNIVKNGDLGPHQSLTTMSGAAARPLQSGRSKVLGTWPAEIHDAYQCVPLKQVIALPAILIIFSVGLK